MNIGAIHSNVQGYQNLSETSSAIGKSRFPSEKSFRALKNGYHIVDLDVSINETEARLFRATRKNNILLIQRLNKRMEDLSFLKKAVKTEIEILGMYGWGKGSSHFTKSNKGVSQYDTVVYRDLKSNRIVRSSLKSAVKVFKVKQNNFIGGESFAGHSTFSNKTGRNHNIFHEISEHLEDLDKTIELNPARNSFAYSKNKFSSASNESIRNKFLMDTPISLLNMDRFKRHETIFKNLLCEPYSSTSKRDDENERFSRIGEFLSVAGYGEFEFVDEEGNLCLTIPEGKSDEDVRFILDFLIRDANISKDELYYRGDGVFRISRSIFEKTFAATLDKDWKSSTSLIYDEDKSVSDFSSINESVFTGLGVLGFIAAAYFLKNYSGNKLLSSDYRDKVLGAIDGVRAAGYSILVADTALFGLAHAGILCSRVSASIASSLGDTTAAQEASTAVNVFQTIASLTTNIFIITGATVSGLGIVKNVIESIFCIQKAKENRHGALKMSKIIMSQQVKEPYFKKLGLLIVEAKNERKRKELKKAKLYASMAIGGVLIGVSSFFTGGVIIGLIALSGIIITAGIRTKIAWNERKNNKSLVRQVRNIDELNKIIALFYSCKSKNEFSDLKSKFPNISIKLEEILKNLSYLEKSNKSILSFFEFTQDSFASKRNLLTFRLNELERHMKLFESLSKKRQIELNISLIELTNDIGVEMKSMLGIFRDEQSGLSFQDPAKKGYLLNSKVLLDILIDSKNGNSMFSEKLGSESELFASIVLNRNFEKYDKKSPFKDYDYLLKKLKKAMKV
ncbi:hypothetical protein HOG98_03875 [bacterium]|jgi:hypothetical protein|nr:hypothetical protein [bacterium]